MNAPLHIGIDLGGTKISAIAIDGAGNEITRQRRATPRGGYEATLTTIAGLLTQLDPSGAATIGIGMPGSLAPDRTMQNANSIWLNGKPFGADLASILRRPLRLANDANCFALSEAIDGAGSGAASVFGIILGTGCGGGLVISGRIIDGPNRTTGEWGHTPLPFPTEDERDANTCWCGRVNCLETWVSGPALQADHAKQTGNDCTAEEIAERAASGDQTAQDTLDRHLSRLSRGLSIIINTIDPEIIVIGGGLSELSHLYTALPDRIAPYIFAASPKVDIRQARHGSDSGVRGAAWLWNDAMAGFADTFIPGA